MRQLIARVTIVCALVCASSVWAKSIADSTAYQGSLNDASGQPVPDGPRDLTITIWTDSVGGTVVHSEIVAVHVKKGLFSTCIGCGSSSFFDIFTEQSLYLQTQLAGQPPMTPRTPLRNTPRALVSSRVRGDIGTADGLLVVGDTATGGSATLRSGVATGAGAAAGAITITGDPDFDLLRLSANADSAKIRISGQSIGDPDFDLLRIQGGVGLNSRGAAMTITGDPDFDLLRMSADADSAKIRIGAKITGDPDFDLLRIVGGSGASHLSMHSALSSAAGIANTRKDDDCDGISARSVLGGRSGSTTGTIRMQASPDSVTTVHAIDSDGDGKPEPELALSIGIGAMAVKGTFTQPGMIHPRSTTETSASSSDCRTTLTSDLDGDGIPESQQDARCTPDSATVRAEVTNGSSHAISNMRTRINDLESRLQNIGLLQTSVVLQDCDDLGAGTTASIDSDNNGVYNGTVWEKVDNTDSRFGAIRDLDQDGAPDVVVGASASSTRSEIKGHFQTGDVPTQSQFSTLLDSKGGRSLLSSGMSGSTTATIRMHVSPDSTVFDLGYSGSTTGTIRMQASSAGTAHPIEHSSGAHLTVGGVWTNASDANLKENFQVVDGQKLLEKIDELPISQWNYKNESDDVTHIGPTAQDFQRVFGVGENDKTISTIDPSGIALAAIKKLNEQNRELKEQNANLKKQLDELARKVEKLASGR